MSEEKNQSTVSFYAPHKKVYPRAIDGMFNRWRWVMVWITQLVFYGLPWLQWGERQMVLFDLGARRFYLFGLVLYPQDFIYLTGLLILSALSLFLFTAVAGRLWCGFTCPQTVYTEIFMWLENRIEGDRSARMRLDKAAWTSPEKLAKKGLKQLAWVSVALWTGFTFVGFFVPIRTLGAEILQWQGGWQLFWVFFYAFATYGFAGFMREQVCKYMCPYARFQSAMFDEDTLIVTYDSERGEPRGVRSKKVDPKAAGLGDCIDCSLCVQVCPTGIDIRNGLQYECIACGACIDACDAVMDKMGYPRGLIRYDTQNGIDGKPTRVLRPRIVVYGLLLAALVAGWGWGVTHRSPLIAEVLRDRNALYRETAQGIENVYSLKLVNKTDQQARYRIMLEGAPAGMQLRNVPAEVVLEPQQVQTLPLTVAGPAGTRGRAPLRFTLESSDGRVRKSVDSSFFGPM